MKSGVIGAVLLLVVLATGCSNLKQWKANGFKVGPDYRRPCVPVADDWIDGNDPSVVTQTETNTDWWSVFNDPTLDQLVQAAYQQNLSLREAGLRVLEARVKRQTSALNLLPQSQTAFGQYARVQLSDSSAVSSSLLPRNIDSWSTGFDLSWELDVWGRIRRSVEANDAALNLEIENYDDILVTLIGDVAATYVQLRSFDERLKLAERNVMIQQGSLELAEARFDEGRVSDLDVEQARSNLADTRALIPSLRQGRRLALNTLSILLGMTPTNLEPLLRVRGVIPEAPEYAVVGIPATLLRRRPDVRAAERAIAVQSAQIGIAEAELYPQFSLSGVMALNAEEFGDLFNSSSTAGFIIPGFSWKILNYGRLRNNIRVEELQFQQSVVSYENVVLSAHREVEDAMVQFLESKRRVEELRKSVEASMKSVELVRVQYKEGKVDFGRVFVLEAALVQRQEQLVVAEADVATGLIRTYKALGGGWQLRLTTPYCGDYPVGMIEESQWFVESNDELPLVLTNPARVDDDGEDEDKDELDVDDSDLDDPEMEEIEAKAKALEEADEDIDIDASELERDDDV